jgi:phosphatidylinositol-3-phosphatase
MRVALLAMLLCGCMPGQVPAPAALASAIASRIAPLPLAPPPIVPARPGLVVLGTSGAQLTTAQIPWRAYMEGMEHDRLDSPAPYAVKHNPFAYFRGACPANVVSFGRFASDLAAGLPAFTWITPDLCHAGHDCGPATADRWLAAIVPQIIGSPGWARDGVLILVWDEGAGGQDQAPLVVLSSRGKAATVDTPSDAYTVLATIEDLFGLPRLGAASQATPFTALVH